MDQYFRSIKECITSIVRSIAIDRLGLTRLRSLVHSRQTIVALQRLLNSPPMFLSWQLSPSTWSPWVFIFASERHYFIISTSIRKSVFLCYVYIVRDCSLRLDVGALEWSVYEIMEWASVCPTQAWYAFSSYNDQTGKYLLYAEDLHVYEPVSFMSEAYIVNFKFSNGMWPWIEWEDSIDHKGDIWNLFPEAIILSLILSKYGVSSCSHPLVHSRNWTITLLFLSLNLTSVSLSHHSSCCQRHSLVPIKTCMEWLCISGCELVSIHSWTTFCPWQQRHSYWWRPAPYLLCEVPYSDRTNHSRISIITSWSFCYMKYLLFFLFCDLIRS